MKKILIPALVLMLTGCCGVNSTDNNVKTFHAAGFDIKEGQPMREFFDDFEEPMHARYIGNDTVKWTYYVDYEPDEGKIVRYCELNEYKNKKKLCTLDVAFYDLKVGNATSTCN